MQIQYNIEVLYAYILEDCIDYIWDLPQDMVIFKLSKKHLFFNFLNFFEIFLNEIRKREISIGLFDYKNLGKDISKV